MICIVYLLPCVTTLAPSSAYRKDNQFYRTSFNLYKEKGSKRKGKEEKYKFVLGGNYMPK